MAIDDSKKHKQSRSQHPPQSPIKATPRKSDFEEMCNLGPPDTEAEIRYRTQNDGPVDTEGERKRRYNNRGPIDTDGEQTAFDRLERALGKKDEKKDQDDTPEHDTNENTSPSKGR